MPKQGRQIGRRAFLARRGLPILKPTGARRRRELGGSHRIGWAAAGRWHGGRGRARHERRRAPGGVWPTCRRSACGRPEPLRALAEKQG